VVTLKKIKKNNNKYIFDVQLVYASFVGIRAMQGDTTWNGETLIVAILLLDNPVARSLRVT
jgi:hypothetical protein